MTTLSNCTKSYSNSVAYSNSKSFILKTDVKLHFTTFFLGRLKLTSENASEVLVSREIFYLQLMVRLADLQLDRVVQRRGLQLGVALLSPNIFHLWQGFSPKELPDLVASGVDMCIAYCYLQALLVVYRP